MLIPSLVRVLRNLSGLTKPVSDKSVNLKAFNNKVSSLLLPFDFKANLFLSSFSNLLKIINKNELKMLTQICFPSFIF